MSYQYIITQNGIRGEDVLKVLSMFDCMRIEYWKEIGHSFDDFFYIENEKEIVKILKSMLRFDIDNNFDVGLLAGEYQLRFKVIDDSLKFLQISFDKEILLQFGNDVVYGNSLLRYSERMYEITENWKCVGATDISITMFKHVEDVNFYALNCECNTNAIAVIKECDANDSFPLKCHIHTFTEKSPSINNFSIARVLYEHFQRNDCILRTPDEQTNEDNFIWCRVVDYALDDNMFVYFWNGESFERTTEENKFDHFEYYFGGYGEVTDTYRNVHMAISKTPLK